MQMSSQQYYEDGSLMDQSPMFDSFEAAAGKAMTSSALYSAHRSSQLASRSRNVHNSTLPKSPRSGLGPSGFSRYTSSDSHAMHQLESLLMQDTQLPTLESQDDFANPLGFMNMGAYEEGSAEVTDRPMAGDKGFDYYAKHAPLSASTVANSPMMMGMMSSSNETPVYASSQPIPMTSVTGYHMQRSSSTSPLVSQSLVPGTPALAYQSPMSQSYPTQPADYGSPTLSLASFKRRKEPEALINHSPYMYSNGSPSPTMSHPGSPSDSMLSHMSRRERNRLAAERCRKKKQELIGTLSGENQSLKQENLELAKVNQVLEQKLDYLINVMANYGIPMPYKK